MKYEVIDNFKVKTSQGEMELQRWQVITISPDKAIKLITEGKITPIERVAYKLYSEILQTYLWVVADEKDMKTLMAEGITEAIYTHHDITELKKLPKEALKEIHKVKQVFPEARVEDTK